MRYRASRALGIGSVAVLGVVLASARVPAQSPGAPAPGEHAAQTPAEVVAALHEGVVAAASGGARSVEERYAELAPVVANTHDLPYIAELAIRRHWQNLTQSEKERFLAAFERLSVMTYVTRFAAAGPDTFAIHGSEEAARGRVLVRAAIARADAADVSLDYLLHENGGRWRIVNILADGVSDLALKRAEYDRALSAGTIEDLIAELEVETLRLQE